MRFFQQLLRLVYRFIFLATMEERGSLHARTPMPMPAGSTSAGYSLARPARARRCTAERTDRHPTSGKGSGSPSGLARGQPALGLPALGGLFAADQCPDLDGAHIENRAPAGRRVSARLLPPTAAASPASTTATWAPRSWAASTRACWSWCPRSPPGAPWPFGFVGDDDETRQPRQRPQAHRQLLHAGQPGAGAHQARAGAGDRRSGSPTTRQTRSTALLSLTVCDPACGCGHFLLAAARRIAAEVARAARRQRTADAGRLPPCPARGRRATASTAWT